MKGKFKLYGGEVESWEHVWKKSRNLKKTGEDSWQKVYHRMKKKRKVER